MAGSGKPHILEKTEPMCCPNTHLKELNEFMGPMDVYLFA